MSNLPNWKAADIVYSKAYRVLESLAERGHATPAIGLLRYKNGYPIYSAAGYVSDTMQRLIDALGEGDEETIKGLLLMPKYNVSARATKSQ